MKTLNRIVTDALKKAGNAAARIVRQDSALYRNMALLSLRLSAKARLVRRTSMFCNVPIAEHCNLKCIGCDNFSPIADEHFMTVDSFKRDMQRLSELMGGKIEVLNLFGGEPLLHPQIVALMRIARECFPVDGIGGSRTCNQINIITNGILLTQMSEEFWQVCKESGICIEITRYPIHIDMDAIHALVEKYGVTLGYWNGDVLKTMWKHPIDIEGRQDGEKSFALCTSANRCANLVDGKIYSCATCAHIEHFNKKFGTHLTHTEGDYVDIYKAKDASEIFDFLCRPVPFCRYCKTADISFGIQWRVSSGDMSEWV